MKNTPKISWNENQENILKTSVKMYNTKVKQLEKVLPQGTSPERVSITSLRKSITTRSELLAFQRKAKRLDKQQSFTVVKSERGAGITDWEQKEIARDLVTINKGRAEDREKVKSMSVLHEEQQQEYLLSLRDKEFKFKNMSREDLKEFRKTVQKQKTTKYQREKAGNYKQRYLKAIKKYLGEDGKELYKLVKQIPADFIYTNFSYDEVLSISWTSDPQETQFLADAALYRWQNMINKANEMEQSKNTQE